MKGIACLFVVWMHCEFPGRMGIIVQAISRFCVPFFFMVSGYYSGDMSKRVMGEGRELIPNKKVLHILKITMWATLFYFIWAVICNLIWQDKSLSISMTEAAIWIVFNEPVIIGGHLWFLFALLYDYILVSLFDGTRIHKRQYIYGAISLALLFLLGQGFHLLDIQVPVPEFIRCHLSGGSRFAHVPNFVYRNWLIEGLAFFMLGRWIKENKDKVKISNTVLMIVVVLSSLLCLVERQIMGRDFGVNICTLPQVFALFLYAVKNRNRHAGLMQRVGKDCSMLVYILHVFIWDVIAKVYVILGISNNSLAKFLLPIFVVVASIVTAMVFNRFVFVFKNKLQMASK